MQNIVKQLEQFAFDPSQSSEFFLVLDDVCLRDCQYRAEKLVAFHGKPGLYIWALKLHGRLYKIYLGRTNSLQRRVAEYCRPFQPHSPNDFKLQAFESYIRKIESSARLLLYFTCVESRLQKVEAEAINTLKPLLNKLPKISEKHVFDAFQKAFEIYYEASFKLKLDGHTTRGSKSTR